MDKNKIDDLKKELKLRDRVVKAMSKDGFFRIVAIKNTTTAITAQKNHNLSYIPAFFLARALSSASMYAALLKGEERVSIDITGEYEISNIYAEAIHVGEVRGYVGFRDLTEEHKIENLSDYLGNGMFTLTRILQNNQEPLVSITPLRTGDIATDLAYYFTQSEQIPTAVILDVDIDKDSGLIKQSGGLILQAMPGHSKETLFQIYDKLNEIKSLTSYFEAEMTPKDLLNEIIPFEFECIGSTIIDFYCRCSKENFKDKLITLGINELKGLQKDNNRELVCHYCNNKYQLTDDDFNEMYARISAKSN